MRLIAFLFCLVTTSAVADGFGFMTPSGNIYCNGQISGGGQLYCTIVERSGPPALPRPLSCNGVWGHEFKIDGRGPVEGVCGGPPERVSYTDVAPYGVSASFGNINCTSRSTGFTCTNADGNGFTLSRRSQTVTGAVSAPSPSPNAVVVPPAAGQPVQSTAVQHRPALDYNTSTRWSSDSGQGVREAFVQNGGAVLRVECNIASPLPVASSIFLYFTGTPVPAGTGGTLRFDNGRPVQIHFNEDNAFVVENRNDSISHFNYVISSLKRHSQVLVSLSNGAQAVFSLRGSNRAIGHCPAVPRLAPPPVAQAPEQQPQNQPVQPAPPAPEPSTVQTDPGQLKHWLITEIYLENLNFNPGPADGAVDASTMKAIDDFRKAYELEGQGPLTAQQFKLLEALALTKPQKQAQGAAKPIISYGPAPEVNGSIPDAAPEAPESSQEAPPLAVTASANSKFVYNQLAACKHERGLATAVYNFGASRPYKLELLDICFDRKSGRLQGAEPAENLTLVTREDTTERYEIIVPNSKAWERANAMVGVYEESMGEANGWVNFSYSPGSVGPGYYNKSKRHKADVNLYGELHANPGPMGEASGGEFILHVSGQDYRKHEIPFERKERRGRETPYMSYTGSATFSGGSGTAELKNQKNSTGIGDGNLKFGVSADGKITASGQLRLRNARLAGANPIDWKTSEWTIRLAKGQFVGETGEQFLVRAIAEGQTVDQDGTVNPVLGAITIYGTSRRLMEMSGEVSN